jgi:hypothetical protein
MFPSQSCDRRRSIITLLVPEGTGIHSRRCREKTLSAIVPESSTERCLGCILGRSSSAQPSRNITHRKPIFKRQLPLCLGSLGLEELARRGNSLAGRVSQSATWGPVGSWRWRPGGLKPLDPTKHFLVYPGWSVRQGG